MSLLLEDSLPAANDRKSTGRDVAGLEECLPRLFQRNQRFRRLEKAEFERETATWSEPGTGIQDEVTLGS